MTAVAAMPGCFNTWLSSVVLPLPRNPVSTVTGMRAAGSRNAMGWPLLVAGRLSRETAAPSRAVRGRRKPHSNNRAGKKPLFLAYDQQEPRGCGRADAGEAMYPLVYWAGLATFAVWT